ncbi:hypothetical protein BFM98_07180 [Lysinibacillus sp. AR18-8]|uniref:hypothetical protein n=1 Tax=Lysinibacillus sp. AR18-8 TaxID=1889781 RepID=UPI000825E61F|nr:hypothetical protein [Lysinibacillus sp. AR18-8]OCX64814.1 hypothetical protein BFM98_07180 [Lysinibacillus sp. AR18-8]
MYSRWNNDQEINDMDSIIQNMLNYKLWHSVEYDPLNPNKPLKFEISKEFEENLEISINNTPIIYNVMKFIFEKIKSGSETDDIETNRIQEIEVKVLIFSDGHRTQFIINRSYNSNTKTILRKLNNCTKNLQITESKIDFEEDLFTWMIYRVMNDKGTNSISKNYKLILTKIIGFKGARKDRLAEIIGTGNLIMNQLSTLAFLFENKAKVENENEINYIKAQVDYYKDVLDFSINLKGNLEIDIDTYTGDFMFQPLNERESNILLRLYLEILPKIIESYHLDKENGEWSKKIENEFFEKIGKSIIDKIKESIL